MENAGFVVIIERSTNGASARTSFLGTVEAGGFANDETVTKRSKADILRSSSHKVIGRTVWLYQMRNSKKSLGSLFKILQPGQSARPTEKYEISAEEDVEALIAGAWTARQRPEDDHVRQKKKEKKTVRED